MIEPMIRQRPLLIVVLLILLPLQGLASTLCDGCFEITDAAHVGCPSQSVNPDADGNLDDPDRCNGVCSLVMYHGDVAVAAAFPIYDTVHYPSLFSSISDFLISPLLRPPSVI